MTLRRSEVIVAEYRTEGVSAFVGDTTKVEKATDKTKTALERAGKDGAKRYSDELQRLRTTLTSGAIPAAENYLRVLHNEQAVQRLTVAEQKRVNQTLEEAIEKYRRLGHEAPARMKAIASATKAVVTENERAAVAQRRLVDDQAKHTQGALGSVLGTTQRFAAAMGVTLGASAVAGFLRSAVDQADQIGDLAERMNVGTDAAQRFRFAARQSGMDIEHVTKAIVTMNDKLATGDKSTVQALRAAGLELEDIRGMKSEDAFKRIAEGIAQIPDPLMQAKVAADLFGQAIGPGLLPMIRTGALKAAEAARVMSDETIKSLKEAKQAWDNFWDDVTMLTGEALADIQRQHKEHDRFVQQLLRHQRGGALTPEEAAAARLFNQAFRDSDVQEFRPTSVLLSPIARPAPRMPSFSESLSDDLKEAEAAAAKLSAAQLRDIERAKLLKRSEEDIRKEFKLSEQAMAAVERRLQALSEARDKATAATRKSADEEARAREKFQERLDQFNGRALQQASADFAKLWAGLRDGADVPTEHIKALVAEMDRLIEVGGQLPATARTWLENNTWERTVGQVDAVTDSVRNLAGWLQRLHEVRSGPSLVGPMDLGALLGIGTPVPLSYTAPKGPDLTDRFIANLKEEMKGVAGEFPKRLSQAIVNGQGLKQAFRAIAVDAGGSFGNAFGQSLVKESGKLKDFMGGLFGAGASLLMMGIDRLVSSTQNETKKGRDDFAKQQGFRNLDALYKQLQKSGSEGVALAHEALNIIGKHDQAGNQRWMEKVLDFLEKQEDLVRQANPTWEDAVELARQYGIEMGALGKSSNQAQLTKTAGDQVVAFKQLMAIGASFHGVLTGMSDEIQEVITQSLRFGLDVPEEMRPMLQGLIDMGTLLDENGQRMTDLSRVRFSKTLPEAVQELVNKLDKLIDRLYRIPDPREIFERTMPRFGDGRRVPEGLAPTELPALPPVRIPSLAVGTAGAYLSADTLANVHRGEAIVKPGGAGELARDIASALANRGGTKDVTVRVPLHLGTRMVAEAVLPDLLRMIETNDGGGADAGPLTRLTDAVGRRLGAVV